MTSNTTNVASPKNETFEVLGMTFDSTPLSAREEVGIKFHRENSTLWEEDGLFWFIQALARRAHEGIAEFILDDSERDNAEALDAKLDTYTLAELMHMSEKLFEHCTPPSISSLRDISRLKDISELKEQFPDE